MLRHNHQLHGRSWNDEVVQKVKFVHETAFWYLLARRALEHSADTLAGVLGPLEDRAAELSLPIHYPREHASTWAVLLQLFEVAGPYREVAGRFGFVMMHAGFDRVFRPKGFSKEVLIRLLDNLRSPAFPGRTRDETIVDTFLANAMKLTDEKAVDPGDDAVIMQSCLTDSAMRDFGRQVVQPPEGLWETTITEYVRRRPGFIRRQFSDPNSWLFD